ncbi:MAG: hypothetical protein Q8K32_31205 [Archangium sp.]|nr:hypothetical protein [Archangium sp.]
MAFKLPGGKRVMRSTGISSAEPEVTARGMLDALENELANQTSREVGSKTTVAEFAIGWTAARKAAKQTNAGQDYDRLRMHVFPAIGAKRLGAVRVLDIRNLVKALRTLTLAPRTVINLYGLVRRLFADAVADELIASSPCVLRRGDLPKKRDKDPSWRAGAVFSREEAELLLSSPLIPMDRKVTYALGLLAGKRAGEIAALRWRSFDRTTRPLPRLLVVASYTQRNGFEKAPKTGNPREVPVHPTLLRILTEWEERGFAEYFGRDPRPDDLLIPNRWGRHRIDTSYIDGMNLDLKKLGLRHRTFHNTRRTFISLGRTDGANPSVLKSITHDQVGDQFDQYTTFTFEAKCEAVSCLKLTGRSVNAVPVKMAVGEAATRTATRGETTMQTHETAQEIRSSRRDSNPHHTT